MTLQIIFWKIPCLKGMNRVRGENVKYQLLLLFIATEFRRRSLNSHYSPFSLKDIHKTAR
jgi:hypothetical protein